MLSAGTTANDLAERCIEKLLELGARLDVRTSTGSTAANLAEAAGCSVRPASRKVIVRQTPTRYSHDEVRWLLVLSFCACGRIGFTPAPGTTGNDDGRGSEDGGANVDGFVRGDVLFTNNVAFVSPSTVVLGTIGGLGPADLTCQDAASAAGFPGNYVAWLSTSTTNAIDRIAGSRGWVRTDGMPFVDSTADLSTGRLLYPLLLDAQGIDASTAIFTGTLPDGTADPFTCGNLISTSDLIAYGVSNMTSGEWTRINASFMSCDQMVRIYCFGVGGSTPITISPVPMRRAFLSAPWGPGAGIAGADGQCQQDALAAGLAAATSFRALLATSTASAASRLSDGLTWARLDGLALAPTAVDVLAGNWQVPLALDATGAHMTDIGPAWVGATTFGAVGATTCTNWSVSNNGAMGDGLGYNIVPPTSQALTSTCGTARRLFCLEQ